MIGEFVNNYEIDEIIDEGGMSIVYLGIHNLLKRKAAIKALNPLLLQKPQLRQRFKAEAEILASLKHPNIITLYDYIENDDGVFLITEFVKGETLENYIDLVSGPIPETKAIRLMVQMLAAIEYMHSKDIIHRDIKPSNFLITDKDEVKLIDFGIAKSLSEPNPLITKDGTKVGTTFYMSPQQVKGRIVDRRTDIYSLGVTLFQMVTGQYPYDKNASEYEIYNKIVNEELPNARSLYIGVSEKIQLIIDKATQKKPIERFQSCSEFAAALQNSVNTKDSKVSLNLQTRFIEASNIELKTPLFNKAFLQNLLLVIAGLTFFAALGTGVFFLSNKDVRHVLGGKELMYNTINSDKQIVENLNFGETVKVLNDKEQTDSTGISWLKVYSLRGNSGYVQKNSIANSQVYRQINSFLANEFARTLIPVKYKRALRTYFVDNKYIKNNSARWKIYPEAFKEFENNTVAFGDFDGNNIEDFACIITGIETKESKLILILDDEITIISLDFSNDIKIRTVKKGKDGGRWFIGNTTQRKSSNGTVYDTNKYENLELDGILLHNSHSNETFVYIYTPEEKIITGFLQAK